MTRYESIRESAVSGQFYSNNPERLRETVTGYLSENKRKIPSSAIGIISPHAGYIFSGPTAGLTISSVKIPDKLIIIGPNHYGEGPPVSVMPEGLWKFPGFSVPVASELSALILDKSRAAVPDFNAHRKDHSIEVQIPFFYYSNPSISFVPIS
ncbi:MAG: AmmeMemoRadiSam system protein B, partial [Elusimicrobia bacterium]|nr:AmmeMemoRadiSam system protein B [Elusimicrobiota bacterium]